jgi:hypothetical protein
MRLGSTRNSTVVSCCGRCGEGVGLVDVEPLKYEWPCEVDAAPSPGRDGCPESRARVELKLTQSSEPVGAEMLRTGHRSVTRRAEGRPCQSNGSSRRGVAMQHGGPDGRTLLLDVPAFFVDLGQRGRR